MVSAIWFAAGIMTGLVACRFAWIAFRPVRFFARFVWLSDGVRHAGKDRWLPKAGRKVSHMRNRKITLAGRGAVIALAAIAALLLGSMPSLAAGDAAAGKQAFTTTCGACHSTEPGVNKLGPSLAGIVGSKSGAVPGYNFSPSLKAANITWDEQTLDKFLENPSADVHGTKMIVSVPNAEHRRNIIAYLKTLTP
jgi:cytochrome c